MEKALTQKLWASYFQRTNETARKLSLPKKKLNLSKKGVPSYVQSYK